MKDVPAAPPPRQDGSRLNPARLVRARFQRWWQGRLKPSDQMTLTQRTVYILPTRSGLMLGATLLVLLLASINYQLNLGYLLTFLLAGSTLAGMHVCHGTLRGLSLRLMPPEPQFCGANAVLEVQLDNPRRTARCGIGLAVHGQSHWIWTDVPAQGRSTVQIAFEPSTRGRHRAPVLTAETRYPLGTFRVWTIWRPAAEVLVYPRPEPLPPPLPPGEPRGGPASATVRSLAGHDFEGVRAYRRGDSLKQLVWKKAATALATGTDALVSRDSEHQQHTELWLDHQSAGGPSLEARLSRLCAWVLQADRLGLLYGLRLPGREIAPASGQAHRLQCLEALALC
ncbi:MAG: DUF58 domain-containing protein [Curvibacter sp.]|nr:DUF58 domain-containing protein [Curvibacter sp.]